MADNRQFTDHNEVGGVNVYLEDKKLAESPSQSTVASTDYFVLKDTDGVPHKIVKADVLEMVRDAMGTILANNNKGTSVAKVPTIGSTGNDLGSSSVADLASVLGDITSNGVLFERMYSRDLNDYYPASNRSYKGFVFDGDCTNKPSGSVDGYLLTFRWSSALYITQIVIDPGVNKIWIRHNTDGLSLSFGNWHLVYSE